MKLVNCFIIISNKRIALTLPPHTVDSLNAATKYSVLPLNKYPQGVLQHNYTETDN